MKIFRKRLFVVGLGLLLVALLIWYAGPYLAFADYHPLAPVWVRLALIALVVLAYVGKHLLKQLKSIRAGASLAAAVAKPAAATTGSADVAQLRARFDEAIAHLQQGKRAANLYELPWYAIIGAPGSGKTTALKNSGLRFPLEQKFGREALRGVGGTRNCDWWFTEEAVLLDTAGRYATQDSDQAADAAGWREFLSQLVKYRGRRPLNGILLTLSAADLLTQQPGERAQHVGALTRRLDELERELKVRLPVYVLVTKADLVAGFNEYFDDLDHKGRGQVWGVTFPWDRSVAGTAAEAFAGEFTQLVQRLNERMPARVDAERDLRRRQAIFAFPQQWSTLAEPLHEYIEGLFAAGRPGARPPLLRGVYFTSGTQEGNPIDRILGAMARSLPQDAVAPPASGAGKAYFIEQLLRNVLFTEAGLAGVNRAAERRRMLLQLGAFAAAGLFALAGIVALSVSYGRNKSYIADLGAVAQQLDTQSPAAQQLLDGLPRLDALRELAAIARRSEQGVPLSMRWGLYQGDNLGAQAQDAYLRELNDFLVPRVAEAIRARLISYTADPDRLYEYLKAYLMLGDPARLDAAQLGYMVGLEWRTAYPGRDDVQARLEAHLRTLLEERRGLRAVPIDGEIVRQARVAIRQASVPRLIYSRLKLEYQGRAGAVAIADELGLGAERVLVRKSGRPITEQVSALYTPAVFESVKGLGSAGLVAQFTDDSWVLGEDILSLGDVPRLTSEVLDLYESDYIQVWDELLRDFAIVSFGSVSDLATGLAIITGPSSPLRALYRVIDRNTYLVKSAEERAQEAGLADRAQQAVASRLDRLLNTAETAAGVPQQAERGTRVTNHFADIHRLAATPEGQARFDRVLAQLSDLQRSLQSVGRGVGDVNPLDSITQAGSGDAARTLRQEAATLPPMLAELVTQVTGRSTQVAMGTARTELLNLYRSEVVARCNELIGGRYPFVSDSATDVPLRDFGRLFGPAGIYDTFFRSNVEPFVDRTSRPWAWRSGESGSLGLSDQILRQFERAEQIRTTFFLGGDPQPQVQFNIVPDEFLDAGSRRARVEIDGKSVDNINGPQRAVPFLWPGPNPGVAAVSFEAKDGQRTSISKNGPWAMFRLLNEATISRQSEVRYLVGWKEGEREVQVIIEASSVENPFGRDLLGSFRCGS